MEKIILAIKELTAQSLPFALATVITRNGSAPRSAGAKMLIRSDGSIDGTVGGGRLEGDVKTLAQECIQNKKAILRHFSFTGKDAADMDSICGGEVEVLIESVNGSAPQEQALAAALINALNQHKKAWLVTAFSPEQHTTSHTLIETDGTVTGSNNSGISIESLHDVRSLELREIAGQTVIIEPVNIAGTVFIFGAGHVSRSLAEFTRAVGFRTLVIDDRAEYANRERFPEVDELLVPASFDNIMPQLGIDPLSFIVIVTRGHLNDQLVLTQALKTNAGYIGMIGSRRKCELIFQSLSQQGFTSEAIARVHAPIGLSIQAETPEEIGISIVAEMIQVRAKMSLSR